MSKAQPAPQLEVFVADFLRDGLRKAVTKRDRAQKALEALESTILELRAALAAQAQKTTSEDAA